MRKLYKSLSEGEQEDVCFTFSFEHLVHPCDIDETLTDANPELQLTIEGGRITKAQITDTKELASFNEQLSIYKSHKS